MAGATKKASTPIDPQPLVSARRRLRLSRDCRRCSYCTTGACLSCSCRRNEGCSPGTGGGGRRERGSEDRPSRTRSAQKRLRDSQRQTICAASSRSLREPTDPQKGNREVID